MIDDGGNNTDISHGGDNTNKGRGNEDEGRDHGHSRHDRITGQSSPLRGRCSGGYAIAGSVEKLERGRWGREFGSARLQAKAGEMVAVRG